MPFEIIAFFRLASFCQNRAADSFRSSFRTDGLLTAKSPVLFRAPGAAFLIPFRQLREMGKGCKNVLEPRHCQLGGDDITDR